MNCEKYIGLDVHQATISVAVMDPTGKAMFRQLTRTETLSLWQHHRHSTFSVVIFQTAELMTPGKFPSLTPAVSRGRLNAR